MPYINWISSEVNISRDVSSYETNKVSLSCYDDKRYVLDDGVNTLAYDFEAKK